MHELHISITILKTNKQICVFQHVVKHVLWYYLKYLPFIAVNFTLKHTSKNVNVRFVQQNISTTLKAK